ncbi:MAG: hypothetical protein LIO71_02675 [Ruminococcus sp.]|nr:hypothetical protein [Ruminococcus sp.]
MNIKKMMASITTLALVGTTMGMFSTLNASADTIGQAWLMMQDGGGDNVTGVSNWSASDAAGAIDIVGNGSYTISFDIPEGCGAEQIDFLGISTDINMYQQDENQVEIYKDMTFDISSIIIDGVEIQYTKSANADGTNDDGATYRLSIYDTWSSRNVQDIDNVVSCSENITINFEVNGLAFDAPDSGNVTTTALVPGASNDETTTTTTATTTTKVQSDVDYSLYNSIINNAGSIVSSKGYDTVYDNLGYYLFDINGDGVEELIVADNFDYEYDATDNVNYVWGYYDIYTIKDGKVVEINQDLDESGEKFFQIAYGTYLSLTVVDGKLAYVVQVTDEDDNNEAMAFIIDGYSELEDGTLSIDYSIEIGTTNEYIELELNSYTDKSALNELTGTINSNDDDDETTTTTTTTTTTSDSPATGDTGLGAVAVAFAAAGLSVIALRKKD